jgi:hypothetical protein
MHIFVFIQIDHGSSLPLVLLFDKFDEAFSATRGPVEPQTQIHKQKWAIPK